MKDIQDEIVFRSKTNKVFLDTGAGGILSENKFKTILDCIHMLLNEKTFTSSEMRKFKLNPPKFGKQLQDEEIEVETFDKMESVKGSISNFKIFLFYFSNLN